MERKGRELVKGDINQIIEMLNKALADEWLAYYQYWLGAKVVTGQMSGQVIAELEEHAADELRHADMIIDRILELGGTPVLSPEEWYKLTNCGYEVPDNPKVEAILKQNIKGEQCAITVYKKMTETLKDKDPITYYMALEILKDEVEHEDDLINILEDCED